MLKNYTSNRKDTFVRIQKALTSHGVTKLMFEYTTRGQVEAVIFSLTINDRNVGFKLPANVTAVEDIFRESSRNKALTSLMYEQAYRTAWANICDWVEAQMALIETNQVEMPQIFLPYVIQKDGRSYYEHAKDNQFLLGSPNE